MKIIKYLSIALLCVSATGCTDLTEDSYSSITSNIYYTNKKTVEAAVNSIYEFGYPCAWENDLYVLQELTADQLAFTTKGKHGWDGGNWINLHHHTWTVNQGQINTGFYKPFQGIGLANLVLHDIQKLDYKALGLTDEEINSYMGELLTARAWYYLMLLDMYRHVPLVTDNVTVKGQATPQEIFAFIETELKIAIPMLPKIGNVGHFSQAAAATFLVRLYLNADIYIGEDRLKDCETYASAIINGDYGKYQIDPDYRGPFRSGINGYHSSENIFEFPHKYDINWFDFMYNAFIHFQLRATLGNSFGGYNGIHLTPSRDLDGNLYSYALGKPFEKYLNGDKRKRQFELTDESANYEGFFLIGTQFALDKNKGYGYNRLDTIRGTEEWSDRPLTFIDQVGRFSEKNNPDGRWKEGSNMMTGEENSGIRLLKFPWLPVGKGCQDNSTPEVRLAEVYYALAECKYRKGDKLEAAKLLDVVRKRNYPDAMWASVSYEADVNKLTDQEFIDEYGREFLAEKRRRTDLIRWGRFGDEWWDKTKEATDKDYTVFPIPQQAMAANPLLKQTTRGWEND